MFQSLKFLFLTLQHQYLQRPGTIQVKLFCTTGQFWTVFTHFKIGHTLFIFIFTLYSYFHIFIMSFLYIFWYCLLFCTHIFIDQGVFYHFNFTVMNRYINTSLNKVLDVKKNFFKCLSYQCLCANVEEYLFYIGNARVHII